VLTTPIHVSANMAFLAIPTATLHVAQRVTSLASTLFATIAVVTGLLNVREHRGLAHIYAETSVSPNPLYLWH
jgi:hypothetical protein